MKKTIFSVLLGSLLVAGCSQRHNSPNQTTASQSGSEVAADKPEAQDRLVDSAKVLDELMGAPDAGIPAKVLSGARCVMVVPSMLKGGFIVGGRHGRGVVTCRNGASWTAPAFVSLDGGSWGAQIGAESVDLVLLFMNDQGVQSLLKDNFKLGGEASVAAGPVGRDAQAATDIKLNSQILSYSRTKGLFAGLELGGTDVRPDDDSTKGFYGRNLSFRTLLSGKVPVPAKANDFVSTVRKYFNAAQ